MPTFIYEVPELDYCIRRPMVTQVVQDLFEQTNFALNDIPIYQVGRAMSVPNLKSTLEPSIEKERLSNHTRIEIDATEEVTNPTHAAVLYPNCYPIFMDAALKVFVTPTIVETKTTVNVRFVCSSRVKAEQWMQSIRRQVAQKAYNPIHTLSFYYPIPTEYMYVLSVIHQMRENQGGYQQSFGEWLKANLTPRFSVVTNQAGRGSQFVIRETQTNIIGYYEFGEEVEKIEKEEGAGAFAVNFSYSFHAERPENMVMEYPIVIHNQIIPKELRDERDIDEQHPQTYYLTQTAGAYHSLAYNRHTNKQYNKRTGWPIPAFDDWWPKYLNKDYESLFRVTVQADVQDLHWVGHVTDIRPHAFKAHHIAYMKTRPASLTQLYDNIFRITLHRWHELYASKEVTVDADLKITSSPPMNLRDMWHVSIEVLTDLTKLSEEGFEDLGKNPDVVDDWFEIFDPDNPKKDLPKDEDGNYKPGDIIDAVRPPPGGGNWDPEDPYTDTQYQNVKVVHLSQLLVTTDTTSR